MLSERGGGPERIRADPSVDMGRAGAACHASRNHGPGDPRRGVGIAESAGAGWMGLMCSISHSPPERKMVVFRELQKACSRGHMQRHEFITLLGAAEGIE
jgi:hypothetical protein